MKLIKFEIRPTITIDEYLFMTKRLGVRDQAEPKEKEKEDDGCDVQYLKDGDRNRSMTMERKRYRSQSRSFGMEEVAKITDEVVDVIGAGDKLELSWNLYQQNKRS